MLYIVIAAGDKKIHEPSHYRALIREMKSGNGRTPECLLQDAYRLQDPYFLSLILFDLAGDSRLPLEQATSMAHTAISVAQMVPRFWRRAELLSLLAKKITSWKNNQISAETASIQEDLVSAICAMPDGKELDDAIKGCAPYLNLMALKKVLPRALVNRGYALSGARTLIRSRVRRFNDTTAVQDILPILDTLEDRLLQSKLIGYLFLQCQELDNPCMDANLLFARALDIAQQLDQESRLETFRYLARLCANIEDFNLFHKHINQLDDPIEQTRLLTTLGGFADKTGHSTVASNLFTEAWALSSHLSDSTLRATVQMNIAQGYAKCHMVEDAKQAYTAALRECNENSRLYQRVINSAREHGITLPQLPITMQHVYEDRQEKTTSIDNQTPRGIRHLLALYDTYEGAITQVHLRAIARAAPLCVAFDMDLALMGFPTDNLSELIEKTIADTNIGRGGAYLRAIMNQQRILLVSCNHKNLCGNSNSLGVTVATTSHPDTKKHVSIADVLRFAASSHYPLKRACFIVGLGKKGLPCSLLQDVPYHIELTGRNISLETCTAMGVIAYQVHSTIIKTGTPI